MLLCICISNPEYVWKETWNILAEDVLYMQKGAFQKEGKRNAFFLLLLFFILFLVYVHIFNINFFL